MDHRCIFNTRARKLYDGSKNEVTCYGKSDMFCIDCNLYYSYDIYQANSEKLKEAKKTKKSTKWIDLTVKSTLIELICCCDKIINNVMKDSLCGKCLKHYNRSKEEIVSDKCDCSKGKCDLHHKKTCTRCNNLQYINNFKNEGAHCKVCDKDKGSDRRNAHKTLEVESKKKCVKCQSIKYLKEFDFYNSRGNEMIPNPKCRTCETSPTTKRCSTCKLQKNLDKFHKDSSNSDGIRSSCILCLKMKKKASDTTKVHARNYLKEAYAGVRETVEYEEEWSIDPVIGKRVLQSFGIQRYNYTNNLDSVIALMLEHHKVYDAKNYPGELTLNNSDVKQLIQQQDNKCIYTNVPLQWTKFAPTQLKASIDRIDSSKPHTVNNCQLTTSYMNHNKHKYSDKEFRESEEYEMHSRVTKFVYNKYKNMPKIKSDYTHFNVDHHFAYTRNTQVSYSYTLFNAIGIRPFETQYAPGDFISRAASHCAEMDEEKFGSKKHTITTEQIRELIKHQNNKCIFTGIELQWLRAAPNLVKASIDRIDNTKPHSYKNCQLTAVYMNLRRNVSTIKKFLANANYHKYCRHTTDFYNYHKKHNDIANEEHNINEAKSKQLVDDIIKAADYRKLVEEKFQKAMTYQHTFSSTLNDNKIELVNLVLDALLAQLG